MAGPAGRQYAGEDRGRPGLRELVDQGGRAVVEQMRIVDEHEERPLPGVVEQLVHVATQLVCVRFRPDEVRVAVEQ